MPDIPIDGVVYSLDGGETYRFREGTGDFSATGIADDPTPFVARAAGPAFEGSTLAALTAPARVSDPVLSGSAILGGTLARQSPGVVTGNPPPEMGPPLFAMRTDSNAAAQIITGASGETLTVDDAIFDIRNQIRTGTRFWNSQGEITLWSAWVEVAEVPQITAEPITMTAGQGFEITFNVEPDSVSGSVDLAVDPLEARKYTGVADPGGETVIGATKAGHQPYSETYTYAPAVIVPDMTLIVEADQRISIDHVDPDGDPFEIQINGQVFIIDPADFGPDQAPVAVEAPEIDGEGGDGEVLTRIGRAVFAGDQEAGAITVSGAGWHRDGAAISGQTGATYTQDEAVDGDKTLTWRETGTNDAGATVAVSNEVFSPAPVVVPEGWWDPRAMIHVDYVGNRARINGTTYASIAAAKTANAIKTNGSGVDYIDVSGLGASLALAAKGITPTSNVNACLCALDDGDDGAATDEIMQMGVTTSSGPRASYGIFAGGVQSFNPLGTAATGLAASVRMALRAKPGSTNDSYRGVTNGNFTTGSDGNPVPAVTRLCLGNRSPGDRSWSASGGVLHEVMMFNAHLTNAEIDALGA